MPHRRWRLAGMVSAAVRPETVNEHLSNDSGVPVNKHKYVGADMAGSIGSGGGEVRLETVNGKIRVERKLALHERGGGKPRPGFD